MGRFANDTANAILDLIFGSGHVSPFPSSYDIALSTTQPANDGTNVTEPVGNGYVAANVDNDDAHFPPASARAQTNAQSIAFPQPTGDWSTPSVPIWWVAFYDGGVAHSPSTFRGWEQLFSPLVINAASSPPTFLPNTLAISAPGT